MHVNVKLLQRVIKHILDEPRRLRQACWISERGGAEYRYAVIEDLAPPCGTVACFAGWVSLLSKRKRRLMEPYSEFSTRSIIQGNDVPASKARKDLERIYFFFPEHQGRKPKPGTAPYARVIAKRIQRFIDKHAV